MEAAAIQRVLLLLKPTARYIVVNGVARSLSELYLSPRDLRRLLPVVSPLPGEVRRPDLEDDAIAFSRCMLPNVSDESKAKALVFLRDPERYHPELTSMPCYGGTEKSDLDTSWVLSYYHGWLYTYAPRLFDASVAIWRILALPRRYTLPTISATVKYYYWYWPAMLKALVELDTPQAAFLGLLYASAINTTAGIPVASERFNGANHSADETSPRHEKPDHTLPDILEREIAAFISELAAEDPVVRLHRNFFERHFCPLAAAVAAAAAADANENKRHFTEIETAVRYAGRCSSSSSNETEEEEEQQEEKQKTPKSKHRRQTERKKPVKKVKSERKRGRPATRPIPASRGVCEDTKPMRDWFSVHFARCPLRHPGMSRTEILRQINEWRVSNGKLPLKRTSPMYRAMVEPFVFNRRHSSVRLQRVNQQ